MRTTNASSEQDSILTECESFGGKAADCAFVAQELDEKLTEALAEVKELQDKIREMEKNQ